MKKLLSLLFAVAIVFSLTASVLAQSYVPVKGQTLQGEKGLGRKKKHHKKKPKLPLTVKIGGAAAGVNPYA